MKSMADKLLIRMAHISDAEELLAIYGPYIRNTSISFEYEVPSVEEFRRRILHTLERYPYIVGSVDGRIVGYAYASPFHERKAYDWAVETSIYVAQDQKGHGYGRMLYLALEDLLKKQNILNLNACIAYTDSPDEHLTNASMHFHEHLGYRLVGRFSKCGYKFGRWYDMIWMEKLIGEHPADVKAVIPIKDVGEYGV